MNAIVFKSFSADRLIFEIDYQFGKYLKTIINRIMYSYRGVPETVEGIYGEFMFFIPEIIKEFDNNINSNIRIYIGMKCNYFTRNKCRLLTTKSFEVMNNFLPLDEQIQTSQQLQDNNYGIKENFEIDVTVLDKEEFENYLLYYVENWPIAKIAKKLETTPHMVKKVLKRVNTKLKPQIKN